MSVFVRKRPVPCAAIALFLCAPIAPATAVRPPAENAENRAKPAVLWRNPVDIGSRDLFNGPGGKAHRPPSGIFTFVKEDLKGSNPKFVVRDRNGVRWKVKLGIEARPETVASRMVWAAGYFADEDYFVERLHVGGLPARLHRGRKFVSGDVVSNARLKRELAEGEREGTWSWRSSPFAGTRELNGLRTVMALINNWDLKDENNAIRDDGARLIYLVSDLGASFGTPGRSWPYEKERGNLESYRRSRLFSGGNAEFVDFRTPARPKLVFLVNPVEYWRHVHLEWVGRHIPRDDVRWMGRLLSRLSQRQIEDAFRAAGYPAPEAQAFTEILETRISQLSDL